MVRESVKNLSPREQQIYMDLDTTELMFYATKNKKVRQAINNIRYLLIVELHTNIIQEDVWQEHQKGA